MRRFRMRTPQLLLTLVLLSILCVVIMAASYSALLLMVKQTTAESHELTYHVTGRSIQRAPFNVIPTARNTKDISREVPEQAAKGLPGRWQHHQGNMSLTSFKTSTFSISKHRDDIVTEGEMIRIELQARDASNRSRTNGGDFWYAILSTKDKSSTAGRVIDHANGKYSVYFFAGWSGKASMHITLVHPSETTDYLLNTVWHAYDRIVWIGIFDDGRNKSSRSCVLRRGGPWDDKCELRHPYALGKTVLLCDKPGAGLKCDTLVAIYNNNTKIRERARELTKGHEALFQGNSYSKRLQMSPITIDIAKASDATKKAIQARIPECEPDQPKPLSAGYWLNNKTWMSLTCRTRQWAVPKDIGTCLRHQEVYLLGDSTSRQWFEVLSEMLGVPFKRQNSFEQNNIYRYFDNFNLTTIFKFHPLCLTGNPRPTPFILFSFEVDVLDALKKTTCNYVIVVSPWAHYPQWTKDMFLDRVSLLKEAILRFRARCPNVPIVVKGPHPRDQPGAEGRIFYNNFMVYQLGKILRDTFHGTGAWFLDVWDMNMAFPHSQVMHMPNEVVKQELSMFLSYVCRKIK